MPHTPKQLEALSLYANMMEEIKIRLWSIEMALNGGTPFPGILVREYCYLQLRMICELIALACLTAHGDIGLAEIKQLRKEYSPDRIFKQLEALKPHFYPEPARQELRDGRYNVIALKIDHLTKSELLKLYGECGNTLHRGSLRNFLLPNAPVQKHFPEIAAWGQKINALLSLHVIGIVDGQSVMICMLRNKNDSNKVQVVIAESYDGPPTDKPAPAVSVEVESIEDRSTGAGPAESSA